MTPTQRALKDLREMKFPLVSVQERWNPFAKCRQDLWGFGDIMAARPEYGIVIIQVTDGTHHAARKMKLLGNPNVGRAIACGFRVELWSYAKRGAAGERKQWALRREELTAEDVDRPGVDVLAERYAAIGAVGNPRAAAGVAGGGRGASQE